jgi:hypothetical protein
MTASIIQFGYTKTRLCLTCRRPFQSAGTHNRICLPCEYKSNPKEWE